MCYEKKSQKYKIAEVVIADITNSFTTENVIFAHFTINDLIQEFIMVKKKLVVRNFL